MPIAVIASALRRLASISALRAMANCVALRVGRRVSSFGHDGERDQDDRAGERGQADIGMEQETDGEVDRHPRQIEQGDRPGAGQKPAHGVEIADRLRAVALAADLERQPDDGVVDAHAHRLVEAMPDAHQDAAADRVDDALRGVKAGHQDQQRDQRRHAAARQHPVVDFQHEQRAGEHQHDCSCR